MVANIDRAELEKYEDMIEMKVELEQISKKCVELIYSLSEQADGKVTSFYRNNRIIILVGKQENKASVAINDVKSFASELQELLSRKIPGTSFLIGIGRQYKTIDLLHKSFSEAHEAIRLMQRFNDQYVVSHFEDYSVYHFLDSNIKAPELESYFNSTLGPIYDHDHAYGTSFMITLENYFAYNRNVSEAAKAMFIHRNTFIYRIDKIKEILNTDLKNSEELLQIQLALKIYRLLHKN
ncbi:Purine catabolism regulatory protein [compost metagenome]